MNVYATHDELRRYLGLTSAQTGDDDLLLMLLHTASRLIEGYTGRYFYPQRATRVFSCEHPAHLALDRDLLVLFTLTNGDGSTLPAESYHLLPGNAPVKASIALDRTQAVFVHPGDPVHAIHVEGTWGFHPRWQEAWAASGDSVQNDPLDTAATTLTVNDADGLDPTGYWARFAVGHLLRIGDEYLAVTAVDAGTNTLTVTRGANGTTPAAHAQGTAINVYRPPDDVRQVCLRVAAWLYKQKDAGFVRDQGGLRGHVVVPPALPDDVQQALAPYVRLRVA
ncbi:MAG: hypothetical protein GYB65_14970 [Chloroflexi bacterium]|nr:hypothetical protein [Chloroflexota bacterium]